jgi:Zn-dependent peptidase ImmA (M78 family)
MSGEVRKVPPLSRKQIRDVARNIRRIAKEMNGGNTPFFAIVDFLDVILAKHYEEFTLEILSEHEMGEAHGITFPDQHLIQIRDDVYTGACHHQGRDRMTLAHELGHYVLHSDLGHARIFEYNKIKPYESSEWQASAFAGELLISVDHISGCNQPFEVAEKFGVTLDAAKYQWEVFKKEGLI